MSQGDMVADAHPLRHQLEGVVREVSSTVRDDPFGQPVTAVPLQQCSGRRDCRCRLRWRELYPRTTIA